MNISPIALTVDLCLALYSDFLLLCLPIVLILSYVVLVQFISSIHNVWTLEDLDSVSVTSMLAIFEYWIQRSLWNFTFHRTFFLFEWCHNIYSICFMVQMLMITAVVVYENRHVAELLVCSLIYWRIMFNAKSVYVHST